MTIELADAERETPGARDLTSGVVEMPRKRRAGRRRTPKRGKPRNGGRGGGRPPIQLEFLFREEIAARYGEYEEILRWAMERIENLDQFLWQEVRNRSLNYVMACLELSGLRYFPERVCLRMLRHIMTWPRHEVLTLLKRKPIDRHFTRALFRLRRYPRLEALDDLLEVISSEKKRRILSMIQSDGWEFVEALRQVPEWMISLRLAKLLYVEVIYGHCVTDVISSTVLNAPAQWRESIAVSLKSASTPSELRALATRWKLKLTLNKPFPPPPIAGDEHLAPISSGADLAREGREMKNCVAEYAEGVIAGRYYFYRWLGSERATVRIISCQDGEWALNKCLGRENKMLTWDTERKIRDAVERMSGRADSKPAQAASQQKDQQRFDLMETMIRIMSLVYAVLITVMMAMWIAALAWLGGGLLWTLLFGENF